MVEAAEGPLRLVERGRVHDPEGRDLALETARERLRLARLSAATDPGLQARISAMDRRLARLYRRRRTDADLTIKQLSDWTEGLQPDPVNAPFELGKALRAAVQHAGDLAAVFSPAKSALAANVAASPHVMDLASEIDLRLRRAALRSNVFAVLALACISSVLGVGRLADALVAALTTPGFASTADRVARRIAYAALASLARPRADEPARAAYACDYLLRREAPGRDELELLAAAALKAVREDSAAPIALIGRWLKWEADYDGQPLDQMHYFLPRLGHVARNLGCSLEQLGYEPLQRGLSRLANDDHGVALILHLGSMSNRALSLAPLGEGLGVKPRDPVARLIGTNPPPRFLAIDPKTRVARLVEDLPVMERSLVPAAGWGEFRSNRSRRERHDAG
jgi:hypothetical protein